MFKFPSQFEQDISQSLKSALKKLYKNDFSFYLGDILVEPAKNKNFGDLSSSISMRLAKELKKSPKQIALEIIGLLLQDKNLMSIIDSIKEEANFINFCLKYQAVFETLNEIYTKSSEFGRNNIGRGKKALLEFVSANPTGPLSIAHARQAAVGDSLGNIFDFCSVKVKREYYVNNEGNQINLLGKSIYLRAKELLNEPIELPQDCYQGEYIIDIARKILDENSQKLPDKEYCAQYGLQFILDVIKEELSDFNVKFDNWFEQSELNDKINPTLEVLRKKGFIYEKDGAVWFKSTDFGDDKDRVIIKSDKTHTYLTPDIAYHDNKFKRGFNWLINIWGPDHHGYISRVKAAVEALGHSADSISILIVQLATLTKSGQAISMSTRRGEYVQLRQLLDEVGKDATRFFLIMRKLDSHLDFDVDLAKKHSSDNPVYYIQYAHARICSILNSLDQKHNLKKNLNLGLLKEKEEVELAKHLRHFPKVVETTFKELDPYAIIPYLQELASLFHKFYDNHRVLLDTEDLQNSRLYLISCIKIVIANGLRLLGVSAPQKM